MKKSSTLRRYQPKLVCRKFFGDFIEERDRVKDVLARTQEERDRAFAKSRELGIDPTQLLWVCKWAIITLLEVTIAAIVGFLIVL